MEHAAIPYLREALIFLAAAGIAVPLLSRLRVNPIIGYLLIGSVIGPYGLGLLAESVPSLSPLVILDLGGVQAFAEIGVVFLMFVIGLELSLERLWNARRLVFGLGLAQIVVTAAAVSLSAHLLGLPLPTALVVGAALALSSTAIVMQLLIDGRRQREPVGRTAFSILLMQDLAVVPLLFIVTVLAAPTEQSLATGLALALAKAALAIAVIYGAGRLLLRPVLREIAQAKNSEMFTAAVLLAAVGVAALTESFGLSMALGALLAGLLLAETEYRHQIEVDIAPFKGLLLGLFFMSVGMGIDWRQVAAAPLAIAAIVTGLWLMKSLIISGLAILFGRPRAVAVETGLLLGQSGEFAFVILASAAALGVVSGDVEQTVLIVASLGMLLTPGMAKLAQSIGNTLGNRHAELLAENDEADIHEKAGHVVIAGFGRVGQTLAAALRAEGIDYVATDTDASLVDIQRRSGEPIHFGDASRAEVLEKAGVAKASVVAVTMNDAPAVSRIVGELHLRWPNAVIHARARDPEHSRRLRELGAASSIPETIEASLRLASVVLTDTGLDSDRVERRIVAQRIEAEL